MLVLLIILVLDPPLFYHSHLVLENTFCTDYFIKKNFQEIALQNTCQTLCRVG